MQLPLGKSVVIFDGECAFCDRFVSMALKNDKEAHLVFVPRQSPIGQDLSNQFDLGRYQGKSMVLIEEGKISVRSNATLRILAKLPNTKAIASVLLLVPSFFRDIFYIIISSMRYKIMGRKESCRVPTEQERGRVVWDSF